jgi:hypothetical protein
VQVLIDDGDRDESDRQSAQGACAYAGRWRPPVWAP